MHYVRVFRPDLIRFFSPKYAKLIKHKKNVTSNKMPKIYISTPVTSRQEATMREKWDAAKARVEELKKYITTREDLRWYEQTVSTFDINDFGCTDAEAMGKCLQAVMECDAILYDYNAITHNSRGCRAEAAIAIIYNKIIKYAL